MIIIQYLECRCFYCQAHDDLQDTVELGSQPPDIVSLDPRYWFAGETISRGWRLGGIHLLRSQNFRDFGPPPPLFAFWAEFGVA